MLVSYNWLKQYTNVEDNATDLAEKITRGGIEIEGVDYLAEELSNVVIGYVESKEKHPDAEKLSVCQVNIGEEENLQIVCGAPNVDAGQYVIVAKVGAKLPGIKIKKAKLRGVESQGMICSLKELGLNQSVIPKNYQEGIYIFGEKQELGADVSEVLGLNDYILDLSITPNRADALSMRGLSYELGALYNKAVTFNDKEVAENYEQTTLSVEVESPSCKNYLGQVIKNIEVKDSPLWLQVRLMSSGIRPINNIVDITNYVLLEFGQPMHAFDKDLVGDKIVIRDAKEGEVLETLDGVERKLQDTDLVITDGKQPIALGGVMGGKNTEVSESTKNIILESAYFNSSSIRRTSAAHGLRSDSSARFEKGIDSNMQLAALQRAVELILELCPNATVESSVGVVNKEQEREVAITTTYINNYLGIILSTEEIISILESLNFGVEVAAEELIVKVPTRRPDITIKQDLVEEVIRIYGYDKLPATLPKGDGTAGELTETQKLRRKVRTVAEGAGLTEVISYALTTPEKAMQFSMKPSNLTELMWPMTVDRSVLRQNMVAGILDTVAYNVARKNKDLALYEIGKVFEQTGNPQEELPTEINSFAYALTGLVTEKDFQTPAVPVDFFYAKGILEALFDRLGLKVEYTATQALAGMHPGRTATISLDGQVVGFVGQVHPVTAKDYNIPETYVAEINLTAIEQVIQPAKPFVEITKFPAVTRDIALLLKAEISHKEVVEAIEAAGVKRLTDIKLFDVFSGEKLGLGMKSMAYTLTFQNPEDTLEDEEVARYMEKIQKSLEVTIGAEVR